MFHRCFCHVEIAASASTQHAAGVSQIWSSQDRGRLWGRLPCDTRNIARLIHSTRRSAAALYCFVCSHALGCILIYWYGSQSEAVWCKFDRTKHLRQNSGVALMKLKLPSKQASLFRTQPSSFALDGPRRLASVAR